jgi:hypothetical protein
MSENKGVSAREERGGRKGREEKKERGRKRGRGV